MKFFHALLALSLVVCSTNISPQASGQVGRHHQSVESLVASADFVAIGKIEGIKRLDRSAKAEASRLFVQPFFSEILKGLTGQHKLHELESVSPYASDFYQKLVDDKVSGVWFVNFSENGKVSVNPPGWRFWAFQELDGYGHSLFAPPMLSNDLAVLTTQAAILTRLRQCCDKKIKKNNGNRPIIAGVDVPRWLVSRVGAGDANSMSFVLDEMCERTAKSLVATPTEFCRNRKLEADEFKLHQLESLGLKLLQHFPSEENTALVKKLLSAPIHRFELSKVYLPRRISAFEILLKWGVAVERPSFWDSITSLDLSNSDVDDDTLLLLGKLSNLEQLNLRNTQVTKVGLLQLRPLRHLSLIELDNHQVTDGNVQTLSEIGLLNAISSVGWKLVDGEEIRSGLPAAINSLSLGGSQLTDLGLNEFSSLENIVWVNLTGTHISDNGLDSLSRLAELKTLYVGDTRITDLGVKKIAQFQKLETLLLTNLQISDKALAFLERLPSLQHLSLEGTNVSPQAVAKLQSVLPACKIVPPRTGEMVSE